MSALKKLFLWIIKYLFITWVLLWPVLLVLLWLDLVSNLEMNFLDEWSFLRVLFYIWFVIVQIAYFYTEFEKEIKKFL